jgi:ATP-dependent protease HslVU (ClpYQ) peptidase subunit
MRYIVLLLALCMSSASAMATTCCWDGKTMATDSQATMGHRKTWCRKMVRSDARHATCACAGSAILVDLVLDYFENETKPLSAMELPPPASEDDGVDILVVYDSGLALFYGGDVKTLSTIEPPFAFGAGGDIALGAMIAGKTAVEAVQIAEDTDIYTGGKINSMPAPMVDDPEPIKLDIKMPKPEPVHIVVPRK